MSFKDVETNFLGNLLRSRVNPKNPSTAHKAQFLNPLQKLDLQVAVKNRVTTCKIQGNEFTLVYDGGYVFYSKVGFFVPCGWLEISRVLGSDFIE